MSARIGAGALFLTILAIPLPTAAQPIGACILSGGQWCVPATPVVPGDRCYCPTGSGWTPGIQG
jgi:hypothetical protein